jgi:ubiquinone/menaquinone biosynthesis C-methylase UbiE
MLNVWWQLVRFGFRLLYNEMAFTYDGVSKIVSLGAWRSWQRAALKHLPAPETGSILELAHGTGDLHEDLYAAGYAPIGYDLSPYMGQIARRKLQKKGTLPLLIRGDARQLPFYEGAFVAVVSTFPTNFIFMPETLREIQRVLRPEGKLIIVIHGVLIGSGVIKAFLEFLYRITGQRNNSDFDIAGLFAEYGFTLEVLQEECDGSIATVLVAKKNDRLH